MLWNILDTLCIYYYSPLDIVGLFRLLVLKMLDLPDVELELFKNVSNVVIFVGFILSFSHSCQSINTI